MECDPGKDDVSAGSVLKAGPEIGRVVILEKDNVEEEDGCDVTLAVGGVFLEEKIETMVDLNKNKVTSALELNPQVEITEADLLTILPPEIALRVFMFMDAKDLLKLAQTCHFLRFLSEDDKLWDDKCKEASLSYCLSSTEEELLGLRDTMNSKLHEILKSLNRIEASFEFSRWKANFLKHLRLVYKMEHEKLLKLKSNLRDLVITEKHGYTEKKLWGHYKEFIGQDLERESIKLGFSCMTDLLDSFRDVIRKGFNQDGEQVYKGIADESTRHMADLIGKTPVTKKKRKGARGRGLWRGRGMLRGRGGVRGGISVRGMRGITRGGPARGFNGRGWMAGRGAINGVARNASAIPNVYTMEWGGMGRIEHFPGSQTDGSFPGNPIIGGVQSVKPNIVARSLSQQVNPGNRFESILQRYFQRNNLGVIPFKVSVIGNKFTSEVCVNSEVFQTSPQTFGSQAEAVEAVSKLCVTKMNILKDGSVMEESKDKVMMVYRLEQILEGKKFGVWSTMVEKLYEKKHREQLPKLWWEKVNVVRVEPLSEGSQIMIVYPIQEENQSVEKDTNHETEVEFGEAEDNFFLVLPELSPPDDDSWAVYISVVASTEEIYVKFIGDDYSEKFDEISQKMDRFYDNVDIPNVEEVILEQIYAAKADGEWHRVQATDIDEAEKVSCWFLDCGDEDVIDKKDLKELDETFLAVPAQAFQISLHDIKDTTENTATIEKLNDELVGKSFIAKVKYAGDNEKVPAVILFDTSNDEEGVNMNEKIQEILDNQELFMSSDDADSTAESSLSDVPEEDTTAASSFARRKSNVSEDDTTSASSLAGSLSDVPEDNTTAASSLAERKSNVAEADAHKIEVLKPLPVISIPRVNEDFDVRCCLTFSPSNFVVQPLDFGDQLEELMSALGAFYNDPSNQSMVQVDVEEGEFVAAHHQDGRWYRAVVVREIGGLLVVRFVDYGENSIVKLDKLQPLLPEFRNLPMQAVRANLAGVNPAQDWTQEDISWFHKRVVGQDFISRVTGVSTGVSGEKVMELVLIDTSHPEVDKYVAKELMDRK